MMNVMMMVMTIVMMMVMMIVMMMVMIVMMMMLVMIIPHLFLFRLAENQQVVVSDWKSQTIICNVGKIYYNIIIIIIIIIIKFVM